MSCIGAGKLDGLHPEGTFSQRVHLWLLLRNKSVKGHSVPSRVRLWEKGQMLTMPVFKGRESEKGRETVVVLNTAFKAQSESALPIRHSSVTMQSL